MALSLNTSHPLYANIRACIAVDPATNQIKELKNGLAVTADPDIRLPNSATFPSVSTPYGPSFRTLGGPTGSGNLDGTTATDHNAARGVSFTPVTANLSDPLSLVIIWNKINGVNNGSGNNGRPQLTFATDLVNDTTLPATPYRPQMLSGTLGPGFDGGPGFLAITRAGEGPNTLKMYKNGAIAPGFETGTATNFTFAATYSAMNTSANSGWSSLDRYVEVMFDKVLSDAEILSLYNSAQAGTFELFAASGTDPAPTFVGPNIANFSCVVGTAITSRDVSALFTDNAPLSFSKGGTWPVGINVSTAGVISGTPSASGTYPNCTVIATDTAAQPQPSNTFTFTVAASGAAGSITTEQLSNNTGSAALANQAVTWAYWQGRRFGDAPAFAAITGSGTSNASGVLVIGSGLPSGTSGSLEVNVKHPSDPTQDNPMYQWATVT